MVLQITGYVINRQPSRRKVIVIELETEPEKLVYEFRTCSASGSKLGFSYLLSNKSVNIKRRVSKKKPKQVNNSIGKLDKKMVAVLHAFVAISFNRQNTEERSEDLPKDTRSEIHDSNTSRKSLTSRTLPLRRKKRYISRQLHQTNY